MVTSVPPEALPWLGETETSEAGPGLMKTNVSASRCAFEAGWKQPEMLHGSMKTGPGSVAGVTTTIDLPSRWLRRVEWSVPAPTVLTKLTEVTLPSPAPLI